MNLCKCIGEPPSPSSVEFYEEKGKYFCHECRSFFDYDFTAESYDMKFLFGDSFSFRMLDLSEVGYALTVLRDNCKDENISQSLDVVVKAIWRSGKNGTS